MTDPNMNSEVYSGSDQRVDWYAIRGFTDTFPLIDGMLSSSLYGQTTPGGVRFMGKRWGDEYNTLLVPDNTLVDLMAHYSFSKWKISANATNLGDRRYVGTCETTARCVYGKSREVFANVGYQW